MSPTAPLRAEMTLEVDGSWQHGVDGQLPAGVTWTTALAGTAVTIIKVELELEISQLH